MLSSIDRTHHSQIRDLLDQYVDIRDHLEDLLSAMQMLQSQLVSDLEDLSDDFDDLVEEIGDCSKSLIRFRTVPDPSVPESLPEHGQAQELSFPDDDAPFPFSTENDDIQRFPWDHTEEEGR